MLSPTHKSQEDNKNISDNFFEKKSNTTAAPQIVDNRPEAIAQRKLQAMADNSPGVQRVAQLQAIAAQRRPVVQFVRGFNELRDIKSENENAFIRAIFGNNFGVLSWKIPAQRQGDGVMGRNCISAAFNVPVTQANTQLSLHINFMVTGASLTRPANNDDFTHVTLDLSLLHITARSAANQIQIVEDGPSILTAARSIHCGPSNDWDWTRPQVNELLIEIGATLGNLQAALTPYGRAYVTGIRQALKDEMIRCARNREVTVDGFIEDNTWS